MHVLTSVINIGKSQVSFTIPQCLANGDVSTFQDMALPFASWDIEALDSFNILWLTAAVTLNTLTLVVIVSLPHRACCPPQVSPIILHSSSLYHILLPSTTSIINMFEVPATSQ